MQVKDFNGKSVIDSREVAAMVEKRHDNLITDIRGYIKAMEKAIDLKIQVNDFFVPSTYKDGRGRELPCFLITKKGCDMIANKLTGEKGVLFTAAYVTAFEDMKRALSMSKLTALPEGVSLNGLARLIHITRRVMLDMGSSATEIGAVVKGLYDTCGVPLHPDFSKQLPGQTSMFDPPSLGE